MNQKKLEGYFLIFLIVGILILGYYILLPFLSAFIIASVASVIFQPVYRKILALSGNRHGLSAFFTSLLLAIFILVPIFILGIQVFKEAEQLYESIIFDNGARDAVVEFLNRISGFVENSFPWLSSGSFSVDVNDYLGKALSATAGSLGNIFSSLAQFLTNIFVFLITLYYLFKDGDKLINAVIHYSPLSDQDDRVILSKLQQATNSSIKGSLAIGFIQGILCAIGFTIFNVPNPILWGAVAAISALIPGIGTALVLTPSILYLFISGQEPLGVGLLLWSFVAVGLIDNLLGPKLIGKGMNLHPLLVFLSVLGGIIFFGPLGFILGPLVLNTLFALLEIYSRLIKPTVQYYDNR
ncbi:MAG: AI-2E family transporter [Candidatus Taylorbacteria bacterium]|nr:AI-2E family transporter [Candidatus Taylorbacteria bacterium]